MPNTTLDIIISRKCMYKIHTLQFPSEIILILTCRDFSIKQPVPKSYPEPNTLLTPGGKTGRHCQIEELYGSLNSGKHEMYSDKTNVEVKNMKSQQFCLWRKDQRTRNNCALD